MKIISVDNFGRDNISDILIAENVNEYYAKLIIEKLNSNDNEHSYNFYRAVNDDYSLYVFDPT